MNEYRVNIKKEKRSIVETKEKLDYFNSSIKEDNPSAYIEASVSDGVLIIKTDISTEELLYAVLRTSF
ncbi:hypothetical protein NBRC3299_2754 [Acetobacter pasteurianus NBRC 3299]|nr:hypothetical protein NBRC3299_2754 [Acetobacter pasteurianus NBRC 3299]